MSLAEPRYSEVEREIFCLGLFIRLQGLVSPGRPVASWRVNEIKVEIYPQAYGGSAPGRALFVPSPCEAWVRVPCFLGWCVSLASGFLDALACWLGIL